MHDWEMTASRFTGFFRLSEEGSEVLIQDLLFEAAVEGLSAEKRKMERDAKKALEADRYPLIRFEQVEALRMDTRPVYQKQANMLLAGRLIIKGVRRFSKLPVRLAKRDDGILITGAVTLDMTDFGLTPPRAMLGMIKTGKEIVVRYELWWVPD